jgi:hypothetical protein
LPSHPNPQSQTTIYIIACINFINTTGSKKEKKRATANICRGAPHAKAITNYCGANTLAIGPDIAANIGSQSPIPDGMASLSVAGGLAQCSY